jgi:hypothetical protein
LGWGGRGKAQTISVLANTGGQPDNIIIDQGSVYWADSLTGNIASVSKSPGGAITNYPVAMVPGGDLAQDNVFLYFAGPTGAGPYLNESLVYKASKSGGLTNPISNGGDHGYEDGGGQIAIGPAGGTLYYTGGPRSIPGDIVNLFAPIVSLSTQGGDDIALTYPNFDGVDEMLFTTDGLNYFVGGGPLSISTDSASLYWSDGASIWQMPLIGGQATAEVSGRPGFINVIATPSTGAAAGSIFWVEGNIGNASLMRRKVGGQIITVLSGIINALNRCFAVDNDLVFCEQNDSLVQVSIDGGTPTVLADASTAFGPVGVAVDSSYVYCSNLAGQILRITRPATGPTPTPTPSPNPTSVSGSGTIVGSGDQASFSLTATKSKKNKWTGNFSYSDPAAGALASNKLSGFTVIGNQVHFSVSVKAGKKKVTFTVNASDNGEPGTLDTFSIVGNGYSASGNLTSGDIIIH